MRLKKIISPKIKNLKKIKSIFSKNLNLKELKVKFRCYNVMKKIIIMVTNVIKSSKNLLSKHFFTQ